MSKKITKKSEDYARWYTDVVQRAELADYAPVKGCMVIRPYGYAIWENMQRILDGMIKASGHENAYFPLFVPESFLKREAAHVEGFAPQCAVVTHGGGRKLDEPLIVRPTSEAIINEMYAQWVHSYRDLPILINQWANIVRWEMRTRLFLRTTEFLWQEGHTAHRTQEEAIEEALMILEMYRSFMHEYLAVPVLVGEKTETERFAGADMTYTCEGLMTDGRALQMGTSHNLGQNFAKAFNILFLDEDGTQKHVWQTSWGVSTRMVGGVVMAHGDDQGLILPPKIAPIQVVIVPIYKTPAEQEKTLAAARETADRLNDAGMRTKLDDRDTVTPGFKFNDWEMRGVPIRLEIGPRDVAAGQCVLVTRYDGAKSPVPLAEVVGSIPGILDQAQTAIYQRAIAFRDENTHTIDDYDAFKRVMEESPGFAWSHWCGNQECELAIKDDTKATIRLIPLPDETGTRPGAEPGRCIRCAAASGQRVYFAKAY
jgi:prolyl-tRNA synthetase